MAAVSEHYNATARSERDAFRQRMQAQWCQIEQYRQSVLRDEGRLLSRDEAAMEWIDRFAAAFARNYDPD